MIFIPLITAYLYRLGGGNIWPFGKGFKAARRYILPALLYILTGNLLSMAIFSLICHFKLDEIEERDWDDVFCYGLAQAWCFYFISGYASILIALSWTVGVICSNNFKYRLPWHWVEFLHGLVIGFCVTKLQ